VLILIFPGCMMLNAYNVEENEPKSSLGHIMKESRLQMLLNQLKSLRNDDNSNDDFLTEMRMKKFALMPRIGSEKRSRVVPRFEGEKKSSKEFSNEENNDSIYYGSNEDNKRAFHLPRVGK
jgi:hypothetical protein